MPVEIVVIAESASDARIVTGLCDRIVLERGPEWMRDNPEILSEERGYRGIEPGSVFLQWSRVPKLAAEHGRGIRALAWGKNRGRADDAATKKALALVVLSRGTRVPDFVILSRDTDDEIERWQSWRAAKDEGSHPFEIVVAAQHPKMEAWLLNGFVPEGNAEEQCFMAIREALGFDPTTKAEELTAQGTKGKRNAKRVLKELTADDEERRDRCWEQAPLSQLKSRGAKTGLADYIDEVECAILPRVGGKRPA